MAQEVTIKLTQYDGVDLHLDLDEELSKVEMWVDPADASRVDDLTKEIVAASQQSGGEQSEEVSPYFLSMQSYGGSFQQIIHDLTVVLSSGAAIAFLGHVKGVLIKWLDARSRRSIRVKYGGVEVEIKGANDIEELMPALEKISANAAENKIDTKRKPRQKPQRVKPASTS